MRRVFADTNYWVALVIPGDQWRARASAVSDSLGQALLVTTEEVLSEFLNFAAAMGPHTRAVVAGVVRDIIADPGVELVRQTHDSFCAGLDLYERRSDKNYSLTDCISMAVMRQVGLREVLTHDHHFVQEGFVALMRE